MRDFVTRYYDDLPTRPYDAWAKLDAHCQNQTGQREFLDFWATIQSVTIVSVSPRDATSVVARLRYVRRNGTSDTEDRSFKMVSVNGALLLDESERIGSRSISPPSTTSQPVTTTTIALDALEGLVLSPDQISDVMAAPGMRVATTYTTMKDLNAELSDKACLPLADPVDAAVYAGGGWYAMRGQGLDERSWNHLVYQNNVVLFSSAHDADTFFTASAQRWPACANRQFTVTQAGKPDQMWTVGPVSNTSHILGATKTQVLGEGWTCHRALTVANNVAIDVQACSKTQYDISPLTAFSIARQIAAKVPTTTTPPLPNAATSDVREDRTDGGHLVAVRLGGREGYDRLVLEFADGVPGYTVGYRPLPARADASGAEIPLPGASALVQDTLNPADARTYLGPSTVSADTAAVTEAKAAGDFEAVLTWVVGLRAKVPFRVLVLDGPPRLVVDFQH